MVPLFGQLQRWALISEIKGEVHFSKDKSHVANNVFITDSSQWNIKQLY